MNNFITGRIVHTTTAGIAFIYSQFSRFFSALQGDTLYHSMFKIWHVRLFYGTFHFTLLSARRWVYWLNSHENQKFWYYYYEENGIYIRQ